MNEGSSWVDLSGISFSFENHRPTGMEPEIKRCDCAPGLILKIKEPSLGLAKGEHTTTTYYYAQYTKEGLIVGEID